MNEAVTIKTNRFAGKKLAFTVFFDAFVLISAGITIVMSASSTYSALNLIAVFHLFNSHLFKVISGIVFMIIFSCYTL